MQSTHAKSAKAAAMGNQPELSIQIAFLPTSLSAELSLPLSFHSFFHVKTPG